MGISLTLALLLISYSDFARQFQKTQTNEIEKKNETLASYSGEETLILKTKHNQNKTQLWKLVQIKKRGK